MTLVTRPLNSRMRDAAWQKKKEYLEPSNTLLLNKDPLAQDEWDEEAIERRGKILAESVVEIWKPADYFLEN